MKPLISIIIPSWNNPEYLDPCIRSIYGTGIINTQMAELIVVNNGKQPVQEQWGHLPGIKVLTPGENLGWEGGLKLGLKHSDAKFVCFQNDDTFIPKANMNFYQMLLIPFQDKSVGMVGPATTVASGAQSIFNPSTPPCNAYVRWLIFFAVMVRREYLDEVGGVDDTLPGGDDFDLSIRMRKANKKIVFNPDAFLIHHGFKTGTRVHGDHTRDGGWNSITMTDRTNQALIQKHGFQTFIDTQLKQVEEYRDPWGSGDPEGDMIASLLNESEKTLELACGFRKTVPWALAVDKVIGDEPISYLLGKQTPSVADMKVDVLKPLPFEDDSFDVVIARHILEHCLDPITTLEQWAKVLKPKGKLIIAVPDQQILNGIPLAPDHCHAFDRDSLSKVCKAAGLTEVASFDPMNGCSFFSVFQKEPEPFKVTIQEKELTNA